MSFSDRLAFILSEADRVDEVSTTVIYFGWHKPGAATENAAIWKIAKKSQTGTVWKLEFADGNLLYDNNWTDRASLTYTDL